MKEVKRHLLYLVTFSFLIVSVDSANALEQFHNDEEEAILVGRISHVEGRLLRYVPEERDWAATSQDAPFGFNDTLYSEKGGRAEIIMPNNTWVRMEGDTQIQLNLLERERTEIDVSSGVARLYNKGSEAVIRARTPFGYVRAEAGTFFDLSVYEDSVEIIALKGRVYFVKEGVGKRFEVIEGSGSLIVNSEKVVAGRGLGDSRWEAWNAYRDRLWARRMDRKGESEEYLPPSLHDHAYILEEEGTWERVYYEGAYRHFWRPLYVAVGWAPFTVGRWAISYGDHTWIPYESFGYVTHHYGNWVFVRGLWYWAPPVVRVRIRVVDPVFHIGLAWYPGRVAWIHFGTSVGWFPLAPHEPYYCHHRWGSRAVVVRNVNITRINHSVHRYRNFRRAVVIHRDQLYKANHYRKYRFKRIDGKTPVIEHYHVTPVPMGNKIRQNRVVSKKRPTSVTKRSGDSPLRRDIYRMTGRTLKTPPKSVLRPRPWQGISNPIRTREPELRRSKKRTRVQEKDHNWSRRKATERWRNLVDRGGRKSVLTLQRQRVARKAFQQRGRKVRPGVGRKNSQRQVKQSSRRSPGFHALATKGKDREMRRAAKVGRYFGFRAAKRALTLFTGKDPIRRTGGHHKILREKGLSASSF